MDRSRMHGSSNGAEWDVVVIGAGPAGAAAAISAARAGHRVLLVDAKRFPRRKVCGGCLNQISTRLAEQLLGAEHPLWRTSLPLDGFELTHRRQKFCFALPTGFAVDRGELDQSLVDEAQRSGAEFRPATAAELLPLGILKFGSTPPRELELVCDHVAQNVSAKVVVVACGLGGRAVGENIALQQIPSDSSRVGIEAIFTRIPAEYSERTIHMVVASTGYVGLTRISAGRLHVAAAVDRLALQRQGPAELAQAILRTAGAAPLLGDDSATWRGTPPLTAKAKHLAERRVFLVGDAASYVEPFTGEGIRWALETGTGVGPLVTRAVQGWEDDLIRQWERWYRLHIEPEQRLCRHITTGLKHATTRWLAHQTLRFQPRFATSIIARLNRA